MFFTLLLDLTVNFASVMGTNSWLNVHNTRFSVSLSSRYQPGHCPLTFHDIAVVVVYCDNCSVATLSFESDVTQTKSLRLRPLFCPQDQHPDFGLDTSLVSSL